MPISEIWTGSATATINSASATPIASLVTGSTHRAWVTGIRISITATSYASGNTLFQLYRVSNAASISGTTTNGTSANDSNAPAALATFSYPAFGTAPTGQTNLLWQQVLPSTTGSSWEEFPPLGYEYQLKVTDGVALWVTASGSAASQTYAVELIWSD